MSATTRNIRETEILKQEAERRVRAGECRPDIAHTLQVPLSTLNRWAAEGRWRLKDIAFEAGEQRGEALLEKIAETARREQEEEARRGALMKEVADRALQAMQAARPQSAVACCPACLRPLKAGRVGMDAALNAGLEQLARSSGQPALRPGWR